MECDSLLLLIHGFESHFEIYFLFSFVHFKCMLICPCEPLFFDLILQNGAETWSFVDWVTLFNVGIVDAIVFGFQV